MNVKRKIQSLGACDEAIAWIGERKTLASIWTECERGDWLLWLAGRMADEPGWPTRKQVVFAASQCARTTLKHVPEGELCPLKCIETVEAWTRGEATIEQVRSARSAAAAAWRAAATAADAADAAWRAATAAATADAAAAAAWRAAAATAAAAWRAAAATAATTAAARTESLKESARIVRSILTIPVDFS